MKKIADAAGVNRLIDDCVSALLKISDSKEMVFLGIQTRGVIIARRMIEKLYEKTGCRHKLGHLDITLYRDDFTQFSRNPVVRETRIDFDIEDRLVILVDDVLFTGRTIRAALDEIMDFGRPAAVKLVVLLDRGGRELPIQADITGEIHKVKKGNELKLHLTETDGEDAVYLSAKEEK